MDNHNSSLTLVIPCFNEASRLQLHAFDAALQAMPWLSLLFVDDGSTDSTRSRLEAYRSERSDRVSLVALPSNAGKGEAVRTGLLQAITRSPLCGFWDADLSAPLVELEQLRQTLLHRRDVDWVWGIRLRSLGRTIDRRAMRHYLGRVFATISGTVLGIHAYDTQCGTKVFRSSSLAGGILQRPFQSRWIFDVELLVRGTVARTNVGLAAHGILEQPLDHWTHREGSRLKLRDFLHAGIDLFHIRRACTTAIESP